MRTLFISNDNRVTISDVQNSLTHAYVNDASGTLTVKDSEGATVYTNSMSYVASSNGVYQGVIPSTTSLTANAEYTIDVTLTSGTLDGFWNIPCVARTRAK